jgi:hypothetical protein
MVKTFGYLAVGKAKIIYIRKILQTAEENSNLLKNAFANAIEIQ